jgi:hypothetical protein
VGLATTQPVPPPRVMVPWWRRPFVRAPQPTAPPLQRLVADLQRLEGEAERLLSDTSVVARGQRLMAVRLAFDQTLLDAARALEVAVPREHAPFTSHERFRVTIDLTAAGLRW